MLEWSTYMERKWTCIFVLSVKPSAVSKLFEQYGLPKHLRSLK